MIRGDWSDVIMHFIWLNKLEKSSLLFTIFTYCFQDSETSFNYSVCICGVAATVLQYNRTCIFLISVE